MSDIAVDAFGKRMHIDNADRDSEYFCPVCGEKMMQKKGAIRINHFAHFSTTNCREGWSSEEGDWHRAWKNKFPVDCQEIVIKDEEHIHRADVIVNNAVIEFQHSPISEEDFSARNSFYQKHGYQIVWVFDCIDKINLEAIEESLFAYSVPWPTVSNPVPTSVHGWNPKAEEKVFIQVDEDTLYEIIESTAETSKFLGKKYTANQFVTKVKQSGVTEDFSFFSEMRKRAENAEREVLSIKSKAKSSSYETARLQKENVELREQLNKAKGELERANRDLQIKTVFLNNSAREYNEITRELDALKEELGQFERNEYASKDDYYATDDCKKFRRYCDFLKKKNQEANNTIENYRKHILEMLKVHIDCKSLLSDFTDDTNCIAVKGSDGNAYIVDTITGVVRQKYVDK